MKYMKDSIAICHRCIIFVISPLENDVGILHMYDSIISKSKSLSKNIAISKINNKCFGQKCQNPQFPLKLYKQFVIKPLYTVSRSFRYLFT